MPKVILIKNNKGGVGKSWITLQLAHALQQLSDEKVLILTTDNQNNILNYSGKQNLEFYDGLESWIEGNNAEIIQVKKEVYFIPLLSDFIKPTQKEKLKKFIDEQKKKFKYILIDSTPTLSLDKEFIELADEIIIPTYLDEVTTSSISNLIGKVEAGKIKAIVPNRFNRTSKEKEYFNILKEVYSSTNIYFSEPIPQLSAINILIEKGKTIFESRSSKTEKIREIILSVAEVVI
ncbi:MAG: ParA family protein [Fusobacteriaceae bacterium]